MHERRNFTLCVLLVVALAWGLFAWLIAPDYASNLPPSLAFHQWASLSIVVLLGVAVLYVYRFEDRLDDELGRMTGGRYYERDGLCIMPLIRRSADGEHAEVSLWYQNRYSGPAEAVIHLRPLSENGRVPMATHRGARDIHFAFIAQPGGYGVVHQPVAVSPKFQGETVEVQLAAAVRWPRGKGDQLRSRHGMACGEIDVDWALAYRQSEHELNGEIEMHDPAVLRLAIPRGVSASLTRSEPRQESLFALT